MKQDPYNTRKQLTLADVVAAEGDTTPETVDGVAFARLYGEPLSVYATSSKGMVKAGVEI